MSDQLAARSERSSSTHSSMSCSRFERAALSACSSMRVAVESGRMHRSSSIVALRVCLVRCTRALLSIKVYLFCFSSFALRAMYRRCSESRYTGFERKPLFRGDCTLARRGLYLRWIWQICIGGTGDGGLLPLFLKEVGERKPQMYLVYRHRQESPHARACAHACIEVPPHRRYKRYIATFPLMSMHIAECEPRYVKRYAASAFRTKQTV